MYIGDRDDTHTHTHTRRHMERMWEKKLTKSIDPFKFKKKSGGVNSAFLFQVKNHKKKVMRLSVCKECNKNQSFLTFLACLYTKMRGITNLDKAG